METIVNFLHEWAIPGLLLCILILLIIGIRQHRVNNAVSADEEDNESSGEGELPLAEESPADEETGNAEAEQVAAAAENAEVRQEPAECLLPPRRFGRYTAVSPTDVVLTAFPDLLPGDADGVEKLRKEFKTLGGKSAEKMTSSERTRYAALAHVLTLYRY